MFFAALYLRWLTGPEEDAKSKDPAGRLRVRLLQLMALFFIGSGINGALAYIVYLKKGDDWALIVVASFFLSGLIVLGPTVIRSWLLLRAYYRAKEIQQKARAAAAAEKKRRDSGESGSE
jgi:hypothetical protein